MSLGSILVIDDETAVLEMIVDALTIAGFQVNSATDGLEALQLIRKQEFDLVVTDVNMPKLDGYQLVEKLRERDTETPVIFLTARNEKVDITRGLKLGADDYITKPFGLEELTLRIRAILKRTQKISTSEAVLECGPVVLDPNRHRVSVEGKEVELSPTEFRLLAYLMENKNRVLTKHALLDEVWGLGFLENATVLDTFISYLRKKIHTSSFSGIRTVRGVGFEITDN
jgi:two-component system OmpR family response regulator